MSAKLITVLLEYEDDAPRPVFHAQMQALGGTVIGVQFNDALAELDRKNDVIDELVKALQGLIKQYGSTHFGPEFDAARAALAKAGEKD